LQQRSLNLALSQQKKKKKEKEKRKRKKKLSTRFYCLRTSQTHDAMASQQVNRPTINAVKEEDINQKLQLYGILTGRCLFLSFL